MLWMDSFALFFAIVLFGPLLTSPHRGRTRIRARSRVLLCVCCVDVLPPLNSCGELGSASFLHPDVCFMCHLFFTFTCIHQSSFINHHSSIIIHQSSFLIRFDSAKVQHFFEKNHPFSGGVKVESHATILATFGRGSNPQAQYELSPPKLLRSGGDAYL